MVIFVYVHTVMKLNTIMLQSTGYDSDVEREKNMDYASKIYANPIREKEGVKPHLQETIEKAK